MGRLLEHLEENRFGCCHQRTGLGGVGNSSQVIGFIPGADRVTDQVDPVVVFRLEDGDWEKNRELLESLR